MSRPVPPRFPGEDGDGFDDDDATSEWYPAPLHPDDRLWRHPAEVAAGLGAQRPAPAAPPSGRTPPAPLAIVLIAGFIGATLSLGVVTALGGFDAPTRVTEQVAVRPLISTEVPSGVAGIADQLAPSVVHIAATDSTGSGIVLRSDGHVLTTARVLGGSRRVEVLIDGESRRWAELVGVDDATDLAVILIIDPPQLVPATIGSADDLAVGAPAVTLGAATTKAASLAVTTGVISALGRQLERAEGDQFFDMLVVDAPLAPGADGGPLLDESGTVVGISHAMQLGGDERLGIATPIDHAMQIANALMADGYVSHAWLGVEGGDVSLRHAERLGVDGGAEINDLIAGGPGEDGGLRPGDVIVAVDGVEIASMTQLVLVLREYAPGDLVEVTVWRDGARVPVVCELDERPR